MAYDMESEPVAVRQRAADGAFCAAMRKAIKQGQVLCPDEIFKDESPFVGILIRPEPVSSGCTSSASLCADASSEGDRVFSDVA